MGLDSIMGGYIKHNSAGLYSNNSNESTTTFTRLGWFGLDWVGLGWVVSEWAANESIALDQLRLD